MYNIHDSTVYLYFFIILANKVACLLAFLILYGRAVVYMTCPDVPRSVWRVCCNPIYMCVVLGTCCHVSSYVGFATFLTKYMQAHFGITAALASIYTGTRAPHCEIGTAGLQRFPIGTTKKTKKNLSDLLKTVASEMRLNFYRASAHWRAILI